MSTALGATYSLGIAFMLGVAGTWVVRSVARKYQLVVAPRPDRWHTRPTALHGGIAIGFATIVGFFAATEMTRGTNSAVVAILGSACVLLVIGIVDDARGIGPVGKFILQVAAGSFLVTAGVVYPLSPWGPVNILVTLFWYVGVVNSLNLLDNMDGATAGVAAVAGLAFAAFFAAAGAPLLSALGLAVAGASLGFLVFNFKPATIFMGDGGSLFLGAVLGGLGAAYPDASGINGFEAALIPLLVLIVPIFDTGLVVVTRTLNGRRISVGGRDHSTHRLVAMGFSEAAAAGVLYAVGAAAFSVAWVIREMDPGAALWLGLSFIAVMLIIWGYLGLLHRYDADGLAERGRAVFSRELLLKRRGLVLLLDVVLFGVAYYGAYVIYYDAAVPPLMAATAGTTLAIVIVLKLAAFHFFRVYRGAWTRAGLADVHRIGKATIMAGLLVVAFMFLLARGAAVPRTVFVLDVLLTGGLAMAARSSVRSLERFRKRLAAPARKSTIIWGAGKEADLVIQALASRNEYSDLRVVGYIDDREEVGTLIHGLPVLGSLQHGGRVLKQIKPAFVILAGALPDDIIAQQFRAECEAHDASILEFEWKLREIPPARLPISQETSAFSLATP